MPLRDHFHPPLSKHRRWDMLHGQWPAMMVLDLIGKLPSPYTAAPKIHTTSGIEIDVATYDMDPHSQRSPFDDGGIATLAYAPPKPILDIEVDLDIDEYEVQVSNSVGDWDMVAAIEIISPANKDRPQKRQLFLDKCYSLLSAGVSVSIIDIVTNRRANLLAELIEGFDHPIRDLPTLYAATCRVVEDRLQVWVEAMHIGQPLPRIPLWLTRTQAFEHDLDPSYEQTCQLWKL